MNYLYIMVRREEEKAWWVELIKPLDTKYKGKWVEGPQGRFWISAVYPLGAEGAGFACMAYMNGNYHGFGRRLLVVDLDANYVVVLEKEDPSN